MPLFHPRTQAERNLRDAMLTAALRETGIPWPIHTEYPLVLGPAGSLNSFCLGDPEAPIAHANLWPRRLISQTHDAKFTLGLVGNVATAAAHRGKGLMRTLMTALQAVAEDRGLAALILWSDLTEFYQKLGFTSCGREKRWLLPRQALRRLPTPQAPCPPLHDPHPTTLAKLMATRYPVPYTLDRSPEDFAHLLRIPAVTAVASDAAYALLGKGCDMTWVVHEWGAPTAEALLGAVAATADAACLEQVLLLTPADLAPAWEATLSQYASEVESVPMAMAWIRAHPGSETAAEVASVLAKTFIWGLDSI